MYNCHSELNKLNCPAFFIEKVFNFWLFISEKCPKKSCPGDGFVAKDCKCWCKGPTKEQPIIYCDSKKPVGGGLKIGATPPKNHKVSSRRPSRKRPSNQRPTKKSSANQRPTKRRPRYRRPNYRRPINRRRRRPMYRRRNPRKRKKMIKSLFQYWSSKIVHVASIHI